jgi:NADPH:quinone reductase-like Zn-dependent oxidoreductase
VLGADVAGTVEQVGEGVSGFAPGAEVHGDLAAVGWGALADYVAADAGAFTVKPSTISFAEAAAIPQAGLLAAQALAARRPVSEGDRVLLIGAGGGVGTFAIQLAKAAGAEVTAVDRADKLDALRGLGADHVIDHETTDTSAWAPPYDLIVDAVAVHRPRTYQRALADDGRCLLVGGRTRVILATALSWVLPLVGTRQVSVLIHRPNDGLDDLGARVAQGQVRPVIDRTFPLDEAPDAFRHYASGRFVGKVVVTVDG